MRTRNLALLAAALVLAAGGGAGAKGLIHSGDIARNAVTSKHLKNGTVTTKDLAPGARVDAAKLGLIQTSKVALSPTPGGAGQRKELLRKGPFTLTAACYVGEAASYALADVEVASSVEAYGAGLVDTGEAGDQELIPASGVPLDPYEAGDHIGDARVRELDAYTLSGRHLEVKVFSLVFPASAGKRCLYWVSGSYR